MRSELSKNSEQNCLKIPTGIIGEFFKNSDRNSVGPEAECFLSDSQYSRVRNST